MHAVTQELRFEKERELDLSLHQRGGLLSELWDLPFSSQVFDLATVW